MKGQGSGGYNVAMKGAREGKERGEKQKNQKNSGKEVEIWPRQAAILDFFNMVFFFVLRHGECVQGESR